MMNIGRIVSKPVSRVRAKTLTNTTESGTMAAW
jgi:hypothetical protein